MHKHSTSANHIYTLKLYKTYIYKFGNPVIPVLETFDHSEVLIVILPMNYRSRCFYEKSIHRIGVFDLKEAAPGNEIYLVFGNNW